MIVDFIKKKSLNHLVDNVKATTFAPAFEKQTRQMKTNQEWLILKKEISIKFFKKKVWRLKKKVLPLHPQKRNDPLKCWEALREIFEVLAIDKKE